MLAQEIQKTYDCLVKIVTAMPSSARKAKNIEGTGEKVSAAELIAYQIGWGKCLIRWYEAGIRGEMPEMPGDGFTKWDYTAIAKRFYEKYLYDASNKQMDQS